MLYILMVTLVLKSLYGRALVDNGLSALVSLGEAIPKGEHLREPYQGECLRVP